jgi:hypothetical protein
MSQFQSHPVSPSKANTSSERHHHQDKVMGQVAGITMFILLSCVFWVMSLRVVEVATTAIESGLSAIESRTTRRKKTAYERRRDSMSLPSTFVSQRRMLPKWKHLQSQSHQIHHHHHHRHFTH